MRERNDEFGVEIVEEKWNTYELEDGARVRARPIFVKVLWPKDVEKVTTGKNIDFRGSFQTVITTIIDKELEGEPTLPLPSFTEAGKMKTTNMRVVKSEEHWNTYELPGGRGRLKLKMVVANVVKVDGKFDENGCPFYLVNSSFVVAPAL